MKSFGKKSRKSNRKPASKNIRLGFEPMEPRQMMTVIPITGIITTINPVAIMPPSGPFAEGTINFNSATGELDIDGSQTHDNNIQIYINHRAGNGAGDLPDLLTVQLSNINSPQVSAFDPAQVKKIVVTCHDGNDFVDNRTAVPITEYGGNGNDILLGGQGPDFLFGGAGDDYLDGRTGDDMIWGEAGNDALFGDDGYDTMLGGDGNDYLFGGRGSDHLYGEGGNDLLFGEQGVDYLSDTAGTNRLVTDFGTLPSRIPGVSSLNQYYVFDKNFLDPAVRSMTRVDYFRDGSITRDDMLKIYSVISTDGVESAIPNDGTVSASELNDLKQIVSTNWPLTMDSATKFLAGRIANGDRANAGYQGTALGNLTAGVTGDHLNKLVDKWFRGTDVPWAADADLSTLRYEKVSGSLFVGGATYDDVDQGMTRNGPSDCYLLAALGEVAKKCPLDIYSMFTDNGDGTWTVRFFHSGVANYVTVNRQLPVYGYGASGIAWGAGFGTNTDQYGVTFANNYDNPNNELWVALAEKAYAQINESGWIGQDGNNSYKGIDLGNPYIVFPQITGKAATYHTISTASALINAINAGQAVTLDTKAKPSDSAITPSHGYIVVGYDALAKTFQLFNPHGYINDDAPMHQVLSPVVEVTWNEISASFGYWDSALV